MLTSKQEHSGQYRRYGDSFYVWSITATEGETREQVLEYCRAEFNKALGNLQDVPENGEWEPSIVYGGPRSNDPSYYFRGYYTLEKGQGDGEWVFTRCLPYCD